MFYLQSFDHSNQSFVNSYSTLQGDFLIDFNTLRATPTIRKIVTLEDDVVIKGNRKVIRTWRRHTSP